MARKAYRLAAAALALTFVGATVVAIMSRSRPLPETAFADLPAPDLANGERIFNAGGCASCHAEKGAEGDARLVLSGGLAIDSPFGLFHAPNISPDPDKGIGGWTLRDFANAMQRGIRPDGEHLYPSFPYTSYAHMKLADVSDLFAYLKTLPANGADSKPHELPFPFNQRALLGAWKMLYLTEEPRVTLVNAEDQVKRGQYLVEGPGHCGECHTPRSALGGTIASQWLAGADNPDGEGRIPNITPGSKSMGSWSAGEIEAYLETGFTPDFDSVGGSMVEVQKNMARLPAEDRAAIAAYLKAIPAH